MQMKIFQRVLKYLAVKALTGPAHIFGLAGGFDYTCSRPRSCEKAVRPVKKAEAADRPIYRQGPFIKVISVKPWVKKAETDVKMKGPVWRYDSSPPPSPSLNGQFSLCAPCGRDPRQKSRPTSAPHFNPHAPHGARPAPSVYRPYLLPNFHPRAPCGRKGGFSVQPLYFHRYFSLYASKNKAPVSSVF